MAHHPILLHVNHILSSCQAFDNLFQLFGTVDLRHSKTYPPTDVDRRYMSAVPASSESLLTKAAVDGPRTLSLNFMMSLAFMGTEVGLSGVDSAARF